MNNSQKQLVPGADIISRYKYRLIRQKTRKSSCVNAKRHNARRVASTPYVVLTGYPPHARVSPSQGTPRARVPPQPGYPPSQGTPPARVPPGQGTPPARVPPRPGYPPGWTWQGTPPSWTWQGTPLAAPWHSGKCCKALWDTGTPPVDRQKDRHVSKHYLPSYYVRGR